MENWKNVLSDKIENMAQGKEMNDFRSVGIKFTHIFNSLIDNVTGKVEGIIKTQQLDTEYSFYILNYGLILKNENDSILVYRDLGNDKTQQLGKITFEEGFAIFKTDSNIPGTTLAKTNLKSGKYILGEKNIETLFKVAYWQMIEK